MGTQSGGRSARGLRSALQRVARPTCWNHQGRPPHLAPRRLQHLVYRIKEGAAGLAGPAAACVLYRQWFAGPIMPPVTHEPRAMQVGAQAKVRGKHSSGDVNVGHKVGHVCQAPLRNILLAVQAWGAAGGVGSTATALGDGRAPRFKVLIVVIVAVVAARRGRGRRGSDVSKHAGALQTRAASNRGGWH